MMKRDPDLYEQIEHYIDLFWKQNGYAPSTRDVAAGVGRSRSTVTDYMADMRKKGILEYHGHRDVRTRTRKMLDDDYIELPVSGKIACGIAREAIEDISEVIRLPASMFSAGDYFILIASGQSMQDIGIDDGDMIIIRKQAYADPGQIVVALIDDENATLKRYYPDMENHQICLAPENEAFEDQVYDLEHHRFDIQGVAVKVMKNLE